MGERNKSTPPAANDAPISVAPGSGSMINATLRGTTVRCPLCKEPVMIVGADHSPITGEVWGAILDEHTSTIALEFARLDEKRQPLELVAVCPFSGADVRQRDPKTKQASTIATTENT